VPAEDDLRAGVVERLEQGLGRRIVAVLPRAEAGVVPVGERARGRMGGKVRAKPLLLRRAGAAAADLRAVGVERDQMPGADVVAVVAGGRAARGGAEVLEVARCLRGQVLVVSDRGMDERLDAAPGGVERLQVV